MTLNYNEQEIELVWSFRSNIYFEQINGKNIDTDNVSTSDVLTLFYCVFIASLQKAKLPICSMTDFLDVLDDNGGEKALFEFSNWYVNIINKQYEFLSSTEDPNAKSPEGPQAVKKSKKKN